MKNLYLTTGCLLVTSIFTFSQNIHTLKGDSLRLEGDLVSALEEYEIRFKEDSTDKGNAYNYACAYALSKNFDKAFYLLDIATKNDTSIRPLTDPDFYYLSNQEKWKDFENKLIEMVETKNGKYKNLNLSKELWNMQIIDQAFYYELDVAEKLTGFGSPVNAAVWEVKHLLNEKNLKRLEEIINEFGWPKFSHVGYSAASAAFLIVQHSDIETQKKYLPLMTEAANMNEANWSSLALLIDRVNLGEGKNQIYGSQIYRNDDGTFYVKNLEEPEYVNQRRAKVGLGPIEEYVALFDIEWKIEQKEK